MERVGLEADGAVIVAKFLIECDLCWRYGGQSEGKTTRSSMSSTQWMVGLYDYFSVPWTKNACS